MKTLIITTVLLACLLMAGCAEEFSAGVATGVAAMQQLAEKSQEEFVEAVNNLHEETAKLNIKIEAVKDIELSDFVKPETVAAIESVKGREKDPLTWLALASVLGNAFWGGTAAGKRIKKNEIPTS